MKITRVQGYKNRQALIKISFIIIVFFFIYRTFSITDIIANDDAECLLKDLGKIKPSNEEIKVNRRSRSAILRLVEKC